MPIDYRHYPSNWKTEIRPRILARAGNRCELCGVDNYGKTPRGGKVVLTIAHMANPDPMDCRDENLMALCQACHLRHDAQYHAKNARRTRERKAGLQRLFEL